jgi:hypothetical protein
MTKLKHELQKEMKPDSPKIILHLSVSQIKIKTQPYYNHSGCRLFLKVIISAVNANIVSNTD